MDAQSDADREWFDTHPEAPYRFRPPSLAERVALRAFLDLPDDLPGKFVGRVRVTPTGIPGARIKNFDRLLFVLADGSTR